RAGSARPRSGLPHARSRFPPRPARARRPPAAAASGRAPRGALPASPAEKPPFERPYQLLANERSNFLVVAVLLGDARVVLQRRVGGLERVGQLVALEDVVVAPGLVAAAVLRIDSAAHRPERPRETLDPDDDPLRLAPVVDPMDFSLREPGDRLLSHALMLIGSRRGQALQLPAKPVLVPLHALEQGGAACGIRSPR